MNAGEFTRFLRSKTLSSGKYIPGIPRDAADLLVEKVAKALGVCCDGEQGYFYVLAELEINPSRPFSISIVGNPCQKVVAIPNSGGSRIQSGGSIGYSSADFPQTVNRIVLVANTPKVDLTVQGSAVKDTLSLQMDLSSSSKEPVLTVMSDSSVQDMIQPNTSTSSKRSAGALRVIETDATSINASLSNAPLVVSSQKTLSSCLG